MGAAINIKAFGYWLELDWSYVRLMRRDKKGFWDIKFEKWR